MGEPIAPPLVLATCMLCSCSNWAELPPREAIRVLQSETNEVDVQTVTGDSVRIVRSDTKEMRFRPREETLLMVPPHAPRRAVVVSEDEQSRAEAAGWSELPTLDEGPYAFTVREDEVTVHQKRQREAWVVPLSQVEKVALKQRDSTKTAVLVAGSVLGGATLVGLVVLVAAIAPVGR